MRYDFHTYSKINDVGKQWIRKYTLIFLKNYFQLEKNLSVFIDSEVSLDIPLNSNL